MIDDKMNSEETLAFYLEKYKDDEEFMVKYNQIKNDIVKKENERIAKNQRECKERFEKVLEDERKIYETEEKHIKGIIELFQKNSPNKWDELEKAYSGEILTQKAVDETVKMLQEKKDKITQENKMIFDQILRLKRNKSEEILIIKELNEKYKYVFGLIKEEVIYLRNRGYLIQEELPSEISTFDDLKIYQKVIGQIHVIIETIKKQPRQGNK